MNDAAPPALLTTQYSVLNEMPCVLPQSVRDLYKPRYDESEAVVIFSSGTTGKRKGISLSHRAINNNGYFSFETCTFNEINKSRDIVNTNIAFVKLKNDARYDLTKEKLNEKINEHISGENLFYKYNVPVFPDPDSQIEDYYFGIKFYDCLIDILDSGRFPYIRPVVLIFEHVKIIGMLLAIIERKYSANMTELDSVYTRLANLLRSGIIEENRTGESCNGREYPAQTRYFRQNMGCTVTAFAWATRAMGRNS